MTETESRQEVQQVDSLPLESPASAAPNSPSYVAASATTQRSSVTRRVSQEETARRIVILLFGIVQLFIGLRFVLKLLDASASAGIVSAVYSFSHIFVGPFEGMFKAVTSGFDVSSIAAFIGWTIIEVIALAILQIATRRPEGPIA
jgi:uncharacterized membrane protein